MLGEQLSLRKQVEIVFREVKEEMNNLTSGILFLHIRNNVIGKFGLKHDPFESKDEGTHAQQTAGGLSSMQFQSFRRLAIEALRYKKNWTHGEIEYEFAVRKGILTVSVQFESSYNMANLLHVKS